jgi:hypothetical protein
MTTTAQRAVIDEQDKVRVVSVSLPPIFFSRTALLASFAVPTSLSLLSISSLSLLS